MLVPVAAAAVALAAALAGYVMVKFYGVVFLGQPREPGLATAHDAGIWERMGLVWLAAGCVALGVAPVAVIGVIDAVSAQLLGKTLGANASGWMFLTPISPERASYAPFLFLIVILAVWLLTWLAVRQFYRGGVRRAPPWDCGFPAQTARMQDTAEGFGQPIRQVFEPFFRMQRELPTPFDAKPRYRVTVEDHLWYWIYLPMVKVTEMVTRAVTLLQRGRISVYLTYSFVTLLILLLFVR
jgi:hypothetical protein